MLQSENVAAEIVRLIEANLVREEFLNLVMEKLASEGDLQTLIHSIIDIVLAKIQAVEYIQRPSLSYLVATISRLKEASPMILSHPQFSPSAPAALLPFGMSNLAMSGASCENTLLGKFLSFSTIPTGPDQSKIVAEHFSNVMEKRNSQVLESQQMFRVDFKSLQV